MKCRICGHQLANDEADICVDCYKKYQEEEDLVNDTEEVYTIRRKYKVSYFILKNLFMEVLIILVGIYVLESKGIVLGILALIGCLAVIIVWMAISKRIALNTKAVIYHKKIVYTSHFWKYNKTKVVKISDLNDITVFQTWRQKRLFKFGDLCFYATGKIMGSSLLNGFKIVDVANVNQVFQEILEVLGINSDNKEE